MAKKNNVLLYVGIGCGVIILVGGLIIVGLGIFVAKEAKDIVEGVQNPGPVVMEKFQVDALPENYHAQLALDIPFIMDILWISNVVPGENASGEIDPSAGTEGLFYFMFRWGQGDADYQKLKDYFEGNTDDPGVLRSSNINVNTKEMIGRGVVEVNGQTLMYITQRGNMNIDSGSIEDSLNVLFLVECPNDTKMRFGFRYGVDPDPNTPADQMDFSQTILSEENIKSFLGQFNFCN